MRNLTRHTYTSPLSLLMSRDIDDIFNRMLSDWPQVGLTEPKEAANLAEWTPKINLKETETDYAVEAELPGLEENQIEVSIENNTLFLKGEKKLEKKEDKENYHRYESTYGAFYRAIPFPGKINAEKVGATMKNGVLTVTAAKAQEVLNSARKITVKKSE